MPVSREAMIAIHEHLIEKNHLREGAIYLQFSRGNGNVGGLTQQLRKTYVQTFTN